MIIHNIIFLMRCLIIISLFFAISCSSKSSTYTSNCIGKCDGTDINEQEFDFIIVGSGAGGGPLAARLAEADFSVLVLEAGTDEGEKEEYQVPALHARATETIGLAWHYFVEHFDLDRERDSKRCDRSGNGPSECGENEGILYPRGGTLGGSTAINAMIAVLPSPSDWNDIADIFAENPEVDAESWRAPRMTKHYNSVQQWLKLSMADPKIAIKDNLLRRITAAAVFEATNHINGSSGFSLSDLLEDTRQLENAITGDINEQILQGPKEGVFRFPVAIENGKRNSTRERLLSVSNSGKALTIMTGAFATRVVWDQQAGQDPRAVGVEYVNMSGVYDASLKTRQNPNERNIVHAKKEVILSAGAFNSPQLLMLSGVGDSQELDELGIETVVERPGVGRNLQDRYEVGVVSQMVSSLLGKTKAFPSLDGCFTDDPADDRCRQEWLDDGTGVYATNGTLVSLFLKSTPELATPDLQIFGIPGNFRGYYPGYSNDGVIPTHNLFSWLILKGHTKNRGGRIQLRSNDPFVQPSINFNYFEEGTTSGDQDLDALTKAVTLVRKINEQTSSFSLITDAEELWPGPTRETNEDVREWIRSEAWGHHASCTVPIGRYDDEAAVLDPEFRVYDAEGLRVVDASVFPKIPGTFIVLPTYMISEKAADSIINEYR